MKRCHPDAFLCYHFDMHEEVFRKVINFRDIGGLPAYQGRKIRKGCIYRSGGPSRMTDIELEEVRSLGIRTVLDLRAEREILRDPDPEIPGAQMLKYSGVIENGKDIDFSPAGMNQTGEAGWNQLFLLMHYYRKMAYGNKAFQIMFDVLLEEQVPILIHCAAGKDRTGVAVMLAMLALGCDDQTILNEYLLSREYRKEILDLDFSLHQKEIETDPVLAELLTIQDAVSENIGMEVLSSFHLQYSSPELFLEREYGLTSEKLEILRNICLEP